MGQSSGKLGAAHFSVAPRLILPPNSGPVGSTTVAEGFRFGSLEAVKIYWTNLRTFLGTATANAYGTFSGSAAFTFTVPLGAATGRHGLVGFGGNHESQGSGAFAVP